MIQGMEALDGAKCVVVDERPYNSVVVAWFGGTTFNVYQSVEGGLKEVTCFNVSDEKGYPINGDSAEEKMREWLESETGREQ